MVFRHRCLAGLLLCLGACASAARAPEDVDQLMSRASATAGALVGRQQPAEAAQFVRAMQRIDPTYPGVTALEAQLAPEVGDLFQPSLLGSNRARRPEIARTPTMKALLYLPDRVADLIDCVTAEAHVGLGYFAKLYATRALQLGGGARAVVGAGTYGNRSLIGSSARGASELTILPLGFVAEGGALVSASGLTWGYQLLGGRLHAPRSDYYQELEDYWSIGATATLLFVGVDASLHPAQIADFFLGIAGIDFLHDDFAHTRGMEFNLVDEALLRKLVQVARSEPSVAGYRRFRERSVPPKPAALIPPTP
jgi:hypothetical protein